LWANKGTYQSRQGYCYTGEWKQNLKHGKGQITHSEGKVFEGEFKWNQKQGFGK